jgi:signal transduction histidine kinase
MHSGIDKRLSHEMDKVIATISVTSSDISIIDFSELNEEDFNTISDASLFLQIYDSEGDVLIASNNLKEFGSIPLELEITENEFVFRDVNIGEDRLRMGYVSLYNEKGEQVAILQLATFENELWIIRNKMIVFNLFILPGLIIIVIVASIIIAKKSFKPVNTIVETAERISARSLSSRIEYKTKPGDELGRLRDTLNGLFDRIESYVNQLSQFTDHASHQLMNPLTAVKTELEYILKKKRNSEEYEETLNKLLIQSDHMIRIVKTMLLISKEDRGDDSGKSVFNLSKLISKKVKSAFEQNDINCKLDKDIYIRGDSEKFFIILQNLIDNAVKFSNEGDEVKVELVRKGSVAIINIADSGIGIDDEEKEKVFDRFYRTERSEKFGIKGYGLGLSLVKKLIEEAAGKIIVKDNHPSGTIVQLEFPLVDLG